MVMVVVVVAAVVLMMLVAEVMVVIVLVVVFGSGGGVVSPMNCNNLINKFSCHCKVRRAVYQFFHSRVNKYDFCFPE